VDKLVYLLNRVIGNSGKKLRKADERIWNCPFCSHHKPKLQINLKSYNWHCWVCNVKGRSFFQLFKKLNTSVENFNELKELTGTSIYEYCGDKLKSDNIQLPPEYTPILYENSGPVFNRASSYLKSRGITHSDILKYNIGYCETGVYSNRIIIPSYDDTGNLNYFISRDFYDSSMKYKNPIGSKDVIGLELFINWDEPIKIVEGIFDAIAIKRNAIPLFGKTILPKLKKKIIEKKVTDIYVLLDEDAINDSMKMIQEFMDNGINVYFTNLTGGDPSDIGFAKITQLISDTHKMSFSDFIKQKLVTKTKNIWDNFSI
jgi:DNA primase